MKIEILPNVWVASLVIAEDSNFMAQKNIKAIINLTKDLSFLDRQCNYTDIVRQNIEKYDIIKISQYLSKATSYIYEKIKKSEGILVVCKNGIQKSPLIILAYLIRYGALQKDIAITIIKTKIPEAFYEGVYSESGLNHFIKNI